MLSIIPAEISIFSLCNKIFSRLTAKFSSKFPSYSLPLFPLGLCLFCAVAAIPPFFACPRYVCVCVSVRVCVRRAVLHVNSCHILYTTRERVSVLNVFQLRNLPRVQIGGDALEMFSDFLHIVRTVKNVSKMQSVHAI